MTYEDKIKASHPTRTDNEKGYLADTMAMKLVGERYKKRDLVNLVRWLIMDNAKIVNSDLRLNSSEPPWAGNDMIKNNEVKTTTKPHCERGSGKMFGYNHELR